MVDYPMSFPKLSTLTWDLPDTQGSLGLLSEPCTPTQTFKKFWGGVVVVVGFL